MKNIHEIADKLKELYLKYNGTDKPALEQIKALAWAADVPADLVLELLKGCSGTGKAAGTDWEKCYREAQRSIGQLEQAAKDQEQQHDQEKQELSRHYSEQIQELKSEKESASRKITSLQEALNRKETGRTALLCYGEEKNLFPMEQAGIVMDVLQEAMKQMPEGSRRKDVLRDIIAANPFLGELPKMRAQTLKQILRSGGRMIDEKMQGDLRRIGIETSRSSKHYALTLGGDARYTTTVPTTPSDCRSLDNVASHIIRNMF